ncbi:MAG: hypothetical protein QHI48_08160, partial [Bacteroidota bacterium]|nr:hypothetical protein [Bacteroidota bacterium]
MRGHFGCIGAIVLVSLVHTAQGAVFGDGGSGQRTRFLMPVQFTENRGQWDGRVRYGVQRGREAAWFLRDGIVLSCDREEREWTGDGIEVGRNVSML